MSLMLIIKCLCFTHIRGSDWWNIIKDISGICVFIIRFLLRKFKNLWYVPVLSYLIIVFIFMNVINPFVIRSTATLDRFFYKDKYNITICSVIIVSAHTIVFCKCKSVGCVEICRISSAGELRTSNPYYRWIKRKGIIIGRINRVTDCYRE